MKMYIFLLLCIISGAAKAGLTKEESQQAFRVLAQSCKEESGASDADVEALILHEPANSMEAKCMRACLMKKFDIMNDEGKFVKDTAMKIADMRTKGDPEKMRVAEEIAEVCKDIAVSDNHCEAAEQYGKCVLEEAKSRGIATADF